MGNAFGETPGGRVKGIPALAVLSIALILAGCGAPRAVPKFNESLVIKVSVLTSGTVLADGSPASLAELDTKLARIKNGNGVVWYYRENPSGEPPAIATSVLDRIISHKLPVKMFSEPDFDPASVVRP
jgi:hypothetical protein